MNHSKSTLNFLRVILIAFSVIMILLTFGFKADAATDTSDMFGVSVVGARVESEYGVSGESSVSFDGDMIIPSLGTFNFPGAYSRISVDIKNTGTLPVKLSNLYVDGISLDYMGVLIDSDDRIIETGKIGRVYVTVVWNSDSRYITNGTETGEFSLRICYTQGAEPDTAVTEPTKNSVADETQGSSYAKEPTGTESNSEYESVLPTSATDFKSATSDTAPTESLNRNNSDSVKTGITQLGIIAVLAVCAFAVLYCKYNHKRIEK